MGAIEAGLVRTAEDALTVLRHASQPLGPMGAEWLKRQERDLLIRVLPLTDQACLPVYHAGGAPAREQRPDLS